MNVDKRIEAMRALLERSRPCRMTVTFADGSSTTTDPAGAWAICHDHILAGDVTDVTADRAEYAELAGLIAALCR